MTQEQIKSIFSQGYNRTNWKKFLSEAFLGAKILKSPEPLLGIDSNIAKSAYQLGHIAINENGIERSIAVFEVTLADGIVLERNRVGLRNLLRRYWKDLDAAFIAYSKSDSQRWRFTYVSELTGYDAEGDAITVKTEPKRYTYVLGEGESTRTACERFASIAAKGSKSTLDDVKEAFSVEKLSKTFFDEYKKQYAEFCKYMIAKPNINAALFNGDEKAIRDFNKKLLGRIVFLYFIQKKGWLGVPVRSEWGQGDYNFLTRQFENFRNKDLFYRDFLSVLFFETLNCKRDNDLFNYDNSQFINKPDNDLVKIPYLNGGLFEEENIKHRELIVDAELFRSLFDFFNQYNFTIYEDDPNDHTVAVDPEMLGHIFENLLEDNKDKGAFYTPKEIVHYMCQESLIEYLCTTLKIEDEAKEREAITNLLKKKEIDDVLKPEIQNINHALDAVKICDPAIGSGAFPMGLLHEIFTAKQTLYAFEAGNSIGFDASAVKLNIIQNSIYGVDIEKGAVDIARLRFWLSLIVDELAPKPLPNLDYKIVVGNSLVSKFGDDILEIDWKLNETVQDNIFGSADIRDRKAQIIAKIIKEQKEFFNPTSDKKQLAADVRNLKIDLLINQLQLMAKTKGLSKMPDGLKGKAHKEATELFLQTTSWKQSIAELTKLKSQPDQALEFFDWKLDFPEILNEMINPNPGFDIVIGNPPYVQVKWLNEDYSKTNFECFTKSTDLYCLFFELATILLKENGLGNFITSNKWIRSDYGKGIKNYFTRNTRKFRIIDFGGYQIFESATVDTNITIWTKMSNQQRNKTVISYNVCSNIEELNKLFILNTFQVKDDDIWIFKSNNINKIRDKIELRFRKIGDSGVVFNYGILTGANSIFILNSENKRELIKLNNDIDKFIVPILRGKDLEKYWFNFKEYYLLNLHNGISKKKINPITLDPHKDKELIDYLNTFGEDFKSRGEKGLNWYNLRSCNYIDIYKFPKIIYADIVQQSGKFYFDELGFYTNDTAFMIYSKDEDYLRFLTGILNSSAANFFYLNYYCGGSLGNKGIRFKKEFLVQLPIPPKNNQILRKTIQIISLKSKGKDTTVLEQQIDILVYRLYELIYEEVKVIDPGFDTVLERFGLTPAAFDRMSIEELAEIEIKDEE